MKGNPYHKAIETVVCRNGHHKNWLIVIHGFKPKKRNDFIGFVVPLR